MGRRGGAPPGALGISCRGSSAAGTSGRRRCGCCPWRSSCRASPRGPHTQATGTIGALSTTAGRNVNVLPLIAPLTWLPNTTCKAPPSTWIDDTWLPTSLSASGNPASTLSTGSFCVAAHLALTAFLPTLITRRRIDDLLPHHRPLKARQRQRRQYRQHGHGDQQFDQREARGGGAHGSTGLWQQTLLRPPGGDGPLARRNSRADAESSTGCLHCGRP